MEVEWSFSIKFKCRTVLIIPVGGEVSFHLISVLHEDCIAIPRRLLKNTLRRVMYYSQLNDQNKYSLVTTYGVIHATKQSKMNKIK